jgi:hypothetical protein
MVENDLDYGISTANMFKTAEDSFIALQREAPVVVGSSVSHLSLLSMVLMTYTVIAS